MPRGKRHKWFLGGTAFLVVGLYLGVTILGPVVYAEGRFQALRLMETMGVDDWRELVVPSFSLRFAHNSGGQGGSQEYWLSIPKLYIEQPVVAAVDPFEPNEYQLALEAGVAQAAGTGYPGEQRLGYYFGHSSNGSLTPSVQSAVFFTLYKLEPGDDIYLEYQGNSYHYQVTGQRVTEADNVSLLTQPPAEESIVLQTCWPVGTSSRRLLVMAKLV